MSQNHSFKDSSSVVHLVIALTVLVAMPLLPAMTGFFSLFAG